MNERPENKQWDFSLYIAKYLVPVLERKWMVLIFFALGLVGALVINSLIKPEYVSRATLLIEEPRTRYSPSLRGDELLSYRVQSEYVIAEVEKLKSGTFAAEVLKILPDNVKKDLRESLGLSTQVFASFLGQEEGASEGSVNRDQLLLEMKNRVKVDSVPRSGIVTIEARSIDQDAAPILIKGMIDVWLALNLEENKKEIRAKSEFALEQRNQAQEDFLKAEQEMIQFRKEYGIPADFKVFRDIEIQLQTERLQERLDQARERLDFMDKTYVATKMKEAGIMGNIKVIDSPSYPVDASIKPETRVLVSGIALGLILGIGLALLGEVIKGPIRHESDLYIGAPLEVLGSIPKVEQK